jgi:acid-sensing ion channel, other
MVYESNCFLEQSIRAGFQRNYHQTWIWFNLQHDVRFKAFHGKVSLYFRKVKILIWFFVFSLSKDFQRRRNFTLNFPEKEGKLISVDEYPLMSSSRNGNGLKIALMRNDKILNDDICEAPSFLVHSPFELPGSYDLNDMIRYYYGYNIVVLITPEIIKTDPDMKSYDPIERGCYFQGEKELKFFKVYTRRNCEMECYASILIYQINCVSYFTVRNESTEICDHRMEMDVEFEDFYIRRELDECNCLDECDSIKYKIQVNVESLDETSEVAHIEYQQFLVKTFVSIEFKFNDVLIAPLRRYQPFTFTEFLAQSGGMMGLFAGISALSVIELFYFFTLRWMVNFCRWLKNK